MHSTVTAAPGPSLAAGYVQKRDAAVAQHLPQVRRIALGIYRRLPHQIAFDDLVQAGVVGLMDAIEKFDPEKHVQFGAYANFRIHGAILDSLRELDWAPRELRKQARRMDHTEQQLSARLGRGPEEAELAQEMGMNVADFRGLRAELDQLEIGNLDAPMPGEEGADAASRLRDSAPTPYEECRRAEIKRLLAAAIHGLPQRERHVLALYYFEDLTMREVGRALGVDESRVSQIHSAAMARLRARICAEFNEAALRP